MKKWKEKKEKILSQKAAWKAYKGGHSKGPPFLRHGPPFKVEGGFFFFWFLSIFGVITLFIITGLGSIIYTMRQLTAQHFQGRIFFGSCLLAAGVSVLAVLIASWARHRITNPLAHVFNAAESVAQGDFSVRLPETQHGAFGRLAVEFNNMVSELERTDQLRRNLTADVAHELNTPLHIVQGYLEGIQDGVYQADEETINVMLEETRLLGRLVADLRTLSLAEAGQLPLEKKQFDLAELIEDVITSFSGQAEAAGVRLESQVPNDLLLTADPDRLDQVLSNLVVNALRYTPAEGEIKIVAQTVDKGVQITVSDTGHGIPTEDQVYIFERFWRGDRARSHQDGSGHGLGLAIARQLVRAHGGQISVQSEAGTGTKFEITLPVDPQSHTDSG